METNRSIKKVILIVFISITGGLFLNSCSQDELIVDQCLKNETQVKTRASSWHWRCPDCGFLNEGWRNNCASCQKTYSPEHGDLVYSILGVTTNIEYSTSMGGYSDDVIIELPNFLFPTKVPESWYNSDASLKYYEELKTMNYYASPEYSEGVEFGWYRTVRVLYPRYTEIAQLDYAYDKWLIGPARNLKGQNGTGIKDGAKAAIKAFKAYRVY